MESIQIYLNSAAADSYSNGSLSDCDFILPNIEIPDGYHIYLSVNQAIIPYSFYNINSINNILYYTVNNVNYNYFITPGNYNINQLLSVLNNDLTGFTITYNNITNTLTFINSTYDFQFLSTSSCLSLLGFTANYTYSSSSLILTSNICIDLTPIKRINIVSNLTTYNINKALPNNVSILCSIPIHTPPYSIIEYQNVNNFKTNLFINLLSHLKIKLVDDLGNLINLNGLYFSMTIQLDIVQFT